MGALFGQAIAAFQGFFSRGFWFGAFLPVAITAAFNMLLARLTFPATAGLVTSLLSDKWAYGTPIYAALIVAAYALAPLVPLCREVLDGRLLPDSVFDSLRSYPLAQYRRAEAKSLAANRRETDVKNARKRADENLSRDRKAGSAVGTATQLATIRAAARTVRELESSHYRGATARVETLAAAVSQVCQALRENDASKDAELNSLDGRILALLDAALDDATARRVRQEDRVKRLPANARDVRATAVGNARSLSELYSQRAYDVDFDFLWSRVQMVIPDNDAAAKRIEGARALVDFAVLSLILGAGSIAVWLPILATHDTSPWPFLLLGGVGPLFVRFLYQLVVASQTGLGDVAQGIVDKYRFDVFKLLHIKPPVTLSEERRLWSSLSAVARGDQQARNTDFIWTHPP